MLLIYNQWFYCKVMLLALNKEALPLLWQNVLLPSQTFQFIFYWAAQYFTSRWNQVIWKVIFINLVHTVLMDCPRTIIRLDLLIWLNPHLYISACVWSVRSEKIEPGCRYNTNQYLSVYTVNSLNPLTQVKLSVKTWL